MNLRAGYPFHLVKTGLPFDYPKLEKDTRTDVLIMGGGISGALAAHYLTREGISCMLVDARSIGLGSTCASTSLLQYEIDTPLSKLMTLVGPQQAIRAYQLCVEAIKKLELLARYTGVTDFQLKPSLYYAAHKKDTAFLKEEFDTRKKHGFQVRYLKESELKKEFGFSAPGAILSRMGGSTNAYRFTHSLLQYNIKKGLGVFDRTKISSIHHHKTGVQLKTENGHRIVAKKMIYATGYEVVNYISQPIVKLHSTYATITESLSTDQPFLKQDTLIWNTSDPYLYMCSTPDRRIMVGGRDEMFFSPVKRDRLISSKAKQLKKDFRKIFPRIPFIPEFSWTGIFGSTKDGLPFIGPYRNLSHSYFALGFGGNGITFSQVAGEIIADMIKGKKNRDASVFSFER